jgi:hypothetical protein
MVDKYSWEGIRLGGSATSIPKVFSPRDAIRMGLSEAKVEIQQSTPKKIKERR